MGFSLTQGLLQIKNAQKSQNLIVYIKRSRLLLEVLKVLRDEGFIRGFTIKPTTFIVFLKYVGDKPIFTDITFISKSSCRKYLKKKTFLKLQNLSGGSLVLTTSNGVITKNTTLSQLNGGEGLFYIS